MSRRKRDPKPEPRHRMGFYGWQEDIQMLKPMEQSAHVLAAGDQLVKGIEYVERFVRNGRKPPDTWLALTEQQCQLLEFYALSPLKEAHRQLLLAQSAAMADTAGG